MRILIVADIHANWPALDAIKEPHDLCLFVGDIVDYGLDVAPCIDWVRRRARYAVRGNHDHGAAQNVVVHGQSGFRYLTGVTRPLTRELLTPKDRRFLTNLPVTWTATIEDQRFLLVHGTPRDPLDEYAPADPDFWARRLEGVDADVICVGHTHIPFVLEVGDKLVINPGSVGLSRDGDPRASYAVMTNGKAEIKRIEYPIEQTVSTIQESRLPDQAKEQLIEVFRTGSAKTQKTATGMVKPRASMPGIMAKPKQTAASPGTAMKIEPTPLDAPPLPLEKAEE
jgi:putative phosphoesterase